MLHLARKVLGSTIRASDGDIGKVEDFLVDTGRWAVRYLLVDTGSWFSGKKVLLSPMSVVGEWGMPGIQVDLTRDRVWNSPPFDDARRLPAEHEHGIVEHYGHPPYWDSPDVWGAHETPSALLAAAKASPPAAKGDRRDESARRLERVTQMTGHHVSAQDGELGHVDDFLIGHDTWQIRYLLLDTSNWLGGRSVLLSPRLVTGVDDSGRLLHVSPTRQEIKDGPRFDSIQASLDAPEVGPAFTIL